MEKTKLVPQTAKSFFPFSHFLVQNGVIGRMNSDMTGPGTESSLTAKALDISLIKLSYLIYKMGMKMPP